VCSSAIEYLKSTFNVDLRQCINKNLETLSKIDVYTCLDPVNSLMFKIP